MTRVFFVVPQWSMLFRKRAFPSPAALSAHHKLGPEFLLTQLNPTTQCGLGETEKLKSEVRRHVRLEAGAVRGGGGATAVS